MGGGLPAVMAPQPAAGQPPRRKRRAGSAPSPVKYFELPGILGVKISFPRPVTAGSFEDRDLHAGQQFVPLAGLPLPDPPRSR